MSDDGGVDVWETRQWPPSGRQVRIVFFLIVIAAIVVASPPRGGWSGSALVALVVLLPVAIVATVISLFALAGRSAVKPAIVACTVAGALLHVTAPNGPGIAFAAVGCALAGTYFRLGWAVALTVAASVLADAGRIAAHSWNGWGVVAAAAVLAGSMVVGRLRRQRMLLQREEELLRQEQEQSAALAERNRLAREIHDVLAHSLSALSLQLETADALLERGSVERARALVAQAGQLAREGLVETRRAVGALRGDSRPLPELLDGLAAGYRADLGAPATVHVTGEPRPIDADASLALFRTAQEAMTNVRKHAPGAPVTVDLTYQPDDVRLRVVNGPTPPGAARPLARTGSGYGLRGLRERAELAGGRFDAEPCGDGYRVEIRVAG
jgi:signal transduction histidine kinase